MLILRSSPQRLTKGRNGRKLASLATIWRRKPARDAAQPTRRLKKSKPPNNIISDFLIIVSFGADRRKSIYEKSVLWKDSRLKNGSLFDARQNRLPARVLAIIRLRRSG